MRASSPVRQTDPECATPPAGGFVEPVFDYPHTPDPDLGGSARCSIIGGYVARDPGLGALYGRYVYADLCSGALRALQLPTTRRRPGQRRLLAGRSQLNNPVSFGEDVARRLYAIEQGGAVYRLAGPPPASCPPPVTAGAAAGGSPGRSRSPPSSASRRSGGGSNAARRRC